MLKASEKKTSLSGALSLFAALLFFAVPLQAAERPIFGPVTYDVKARYGRENRYQETIAAAEGLYLIEIRNGELAPQRPDLLSFSVNGETLLKESQYGYRYLACFVQLKSTSVIELAIKDFTPPPFKKPRLTVRNAVITITPAAVKLKSVALGVHAEEDVKHYVDVLRKIQSPESSALAFAAANLKDDPETRSGAMRMLAIRKDPNARDFILSRFYDLSESSLVRGEAVLALGALGETAALPSIIQGMLDPDEMIRTGAVRAISLYKEEDTKELLVKTLVRMDPTMRSGVVRTFASIGWRPAGMLLELAASPDPDLANMGISMLAGSTDRAAVDALLAYLESPGPRDARLIIAALGESKDKRALAQLSKIAGDPAQGRGLEAELGSALAALGDPKAEDLIVAMLKRMDARYPAYHKLRDVYKKLTGKDYKQVQEPGKKGS